MDEDRHECQICGRQIKAKNGKIAHHGYERPGWGYQTSSCAGARHVPYSKGHDALDRQLTLVPEYIARQEESLQNWKVSPPDEIEERRSMHTKHNGARKYKKPEGFDPAASLKRGYGFQGYDAEFIGHARQMEQRIKGLRSMLEFLQKRRDEWKPEA